MASGEQLESIEVQSFCLSRQQIILLPTSDSE
jgi:hypothetical protein